MKDKNRRTPIAKHDVTVWDEQAGAYSVVTCYVEIDSYRIAEELARKAIRNKKGISKIAHGAIAVKVA